MPCPQKLKFEKDLTQIHRMIESGVPTHNLKMTKAKPLTTAPQGTHIIISIVLQAIFQSIELHFSNKHAVYRLTC